MGARPSGLPAAAAGSLITPGAAAVRDDGGMLPETPALLELRHAVRGWLARYPGPVAVALSGGADSLALTAATVAQVPDVLALIVDHRLQPGSQQVAERAAAHATTLGCREVQILPVDVVGAGGLEAAARRARYAALGRARHGRNVLLGHTLDDQAETVLLGLARGSGPRSIWGMTDYDAPWGRPLLGVRRAVTRQACADLGLTPYADPHNDAPEFTRVRLRHEVLPLLDDVLGGGVADALARTAAQLREDGEVLDAQAAAMLDASDAAAGLSVPDLAGQPPAVRRRAIRLWLHANGAKALTDKHLRAVDDLVGDWRGQGGVAIGGGTPEARLVVVRRHGRLTLESEPR